MTSPAIAVKGLKYNIAGKDIVDLPDFSVEVGSTTAIIGPNGAGKSSLLKLLHLIESPTAGSIEILGRSADRGSIPELRRKMTMVFQEPFLLDKTVEKNIAYGLSIRHMDRQVIEKRVNDYSLLLGINHLLPRSVRGLSGGEAHRVCIARALALEPEIIFLDEPLASMDPPSRDLMSRELPRMFRGLRKTVMYVTQDRVHALALGADRLAVMIDGCMVQDGPPSEVMARPNSEEVARFIGTENVWPGKIVTADGTLAKVDIGGVEIAVATDITIGHSVNVCLRPEELAISREHDGSSHRNVLAATIEGMTQLGSLVRVDMRGSTAMVASITKASADELDLKEGDRVWAVFKATAPHVLCRD